MYRIQLQHKDFMVINKGPGLGMHDEGGEPGLVTRLRTERTPLVWNLVGSTCSASLTTERSELNMMVP